MSAIDQIGTPGTPWGAAERELWRTRQLPKRSYEHDVVSRINALRAAYDVEIYGTLDVASDAHRLYAIRSKDWSTERPLVLITGGIHGYETSGVMGALEFVERHGADYPDVDLLVAPCVSPWAYERIHRWNAGALDPNRSFYEGTKAEECAALMRLVAPDADRVLLHIDLHETTDSDESEFRPALAARDGVVYEPGLIPDGFYLCGDEANPQLDFQAAIIEAVRTVTHIAPSDDNGQLIEHDALAEGVIVFAMKPLGLGGAMTNAPYRTLTEVYPDSPRATPEQCNAAQVIAVQTAIAYALAHR